MFRELKKEDVGSNYKSVRTICVITMGFITNHLVVVLGGSNRM